MTDGRPVFDLASARAAAANGTLEAWVHSYLKGPGRNIPFSEGLLRVRRFWRGPVSVATERLERTCGPEPGMPFREPAGSWAARVAELVASHVDVDRYPPLLVQYESGRFLVRDGNHRHAALEALGVGHCWVIFWYAGADDFEAHGAHGFEV